MIKTNRFLLLFVTSCLLSVASFAQQDKAVAKKLKGVDQYIRKAMKDWKVPGVAMVVVQNGKVVYQKGYGYRNVEKKLPVTNQTMFAIGSSSKAFTAASVCQLVDDGKLELDKPVKDYLPDFKMYDDYVTAHMTPRDLLCHRSGLPRHDLVWYGSDYSREKMYQNLHHLEPTMGFREGWQYQNLMFMTAGYLVGQVSGSTWEKAVARRIFKPLGMTSSNFSIEKMKGASDVALGYDEEKEKLKVLPYRNIDAVGPAGSINSNTNDMAKWLIMQLGKGKYKGKEVVSAGMLKQMHSPASLVPGNASKYSSHVSYGLGWFISTYRGQLLIDHGGNIDGFSAIVALMPRKKTGIVILTNKNGTPITRIIRNKVLDRLAGLEEVDWSKKGLDRLAKRKASLKKAKKNKKTDQIKGTKPSRKLQHYTGKFRQAAYGDMVVVLKDKQLRVKYHSFDVPLKHYHYDVFELASSAFKGVKVVFNSNAKGKIDKVSAQLQAGIAPIVFERHKAQVNLSKAALSLYTGKYSLNGTTVKVWSRNNQLMVSLPGQPDWELVSLKKPHTFDFKDKRLKGYQMVFTVKKGTATEVTFHQPNGVFTAKKKK
ncbi:serine hydrolase [Microscilla marina]|uniref:Penicillin-binding protein n=1 Tax=Microscilla marina ATCC 23134 TaxID=313606 RepID=A1ZPU9_MICM2|nr:serine hydrolase [Microscilla marina]EAY27604.1 penicillin-binding protein [Microscilla marina ATCC 23134]